MIFIAYSTLFFSVILLFYSFLIAQKKRHRKLPSLTEQNPAEQTTLIKRILVIIQKLFKKWFQREHIQEHLNELQKKLEYAGISDQYTSEEYLSLHFLGAGTGFLLSVFCSLALMHSEAESFTPLHGLLLVLFFTGIGFITPSIKLNELISSRRKAIIRALPFTLDLITISVEAGLDFSGAISRIVERSEMNELLYEFYIFLHETKLGKRKVEAFERMSERINIPSVNAIITSLIQAEELGMRIGQILRIQSLSMRTKRMQQAEKMAMEAPVKMLIPLAIFIFPAVFIVLLGPLIIQFISR